MEDVKEANLAEERILRHLDEWVDRLRPILGLELPTWDAREYDEQVVWLRTKYSQHDLKAFWSHCFTILDGYDHKNVEWDLLTDEMDPIWMALDPESRA